MLVNDLFNVMSDDARITIHDLSGARIIANACKDETPEFMLDYEIRDIAVLDNGFSVVINNETYLQAFSIMRELVNELDDLGDCRSLEQATEETLERLRDISHTARRLRDNIRRGRSWRYDLFPTCERLRERRG